MSAADMEMGRAPPAPGAASVPPRTTGIKPPPGRASAGGVNGSTVAPSPFYYEPVAATERRWKPWLVLVIVLVCVALFVVVMYYNNCPKNGSPYGSCVAPFLGWFSFQPLKENPLLGPSATTLDNFGALDYNKTVHGGQGWRLETCTWLHAGVIHLLANMISLLFIGIRLEQQFGFWRVGIIYLLTGFGGSVLSALFIQNSISVGASGALFGLLGAMLSELITNWSIYENRLCALLNLIVVAAINLVVGLLPHVDNFAHIGGFASGFLLGFVLLMQPHFSYLQRYSQRPGSKPQGLKYSPSQIILCVIALVVFVGGYVAGLIVLFKGVNGNDGCSWCHYLSCVPTGAWSCSNN